jgi:cysteine desulfurase
VYTPARAAKAALDKARQDIAAAIGAEAREIFFTSGGTEADNWAVKGAADALAEKGGHIITTAVEHHAVMRACQHLAGRGFEVTFLGVDEFGRVSPDGVKAAIRPDTILVSVMFANNEVGTIQPVEEIGAVCAERGVLFHTDAVQAVGCVPIDVKKANISMLSLSGHKLYAPKGAGALFVKNGVKITPLMHGGAQERGRRSGTENVAGIAALGEAVRLAAAGMSGEVARVTALRDRLIAGLTAMPDVKLNGHPSERLPGNVNVSFKYIEGESILLLLDIKGICASSGSACTSGSLDPSHVLLAMGLPHELAHGSLRLTLGRYNTEEDVDKVLAEIKPIAERLRAMSPLTGI